MSAVFVFKAIKPKRLKVDAYRLEILRRKCFNGSNRKSRGSTTLGVDRLGNQGTYNQC